MTELKKRTYIDDNDNVSFNLLALLAHVFANALGLDLGVALMAQRATRVLDEAEVGQLLVAHLAGEAVRVPSHRHGLDHAAHDELA